MEVTEPTQQHEPQQQVPEQSLQWPALPTQPISRRTLSDTNISRKTDRVKEELDKAKAEKHKAKVEIESWVKQFKASSGRAPTAAEKEQIGEKYKAYLRASKRVKAAKKRSAAVAGASAFAKLATASKAKQRQGAATGRNSAPAAASGFVAGSQGRMATLVERSFNDRFERIREELHQHPGELASTPLAEDDLTKVEGGELKEESDAALEESGAEDKVIAEGKAAVGRGTGRSPADVEIDCFSSDAPPEPELAIGDIVLDLQEQVDFVPSPPLLRDFELEAPRQTLEIASVSKADVERTERQLHSARLQDARRRAFAYRKQEVNLVSREQGARERVQELTTAAHQRVKEERRLLWTQHVTQRQTIRRQFRRARDELERIVAEQAARIREVYGELKVSHWTAARRFHVDWNLRPQPVEVRLQLMRSVGDKLPKGRYVVLLSAFDRLGGAPLAWSKAADRRAFAARRSATQPVHHRGRYYDHNLRIDQSVFALCPSSHKIRPGNVFVIEMFRLAGKGNTRDRVVAWGVLPMCNSQFGVVSGKFRIPLLRGEVDRRLDRHSSIERLYSKDLGFWLANLYVEVRHLPREVLDDQGVLLNETDIEVDFVNGLLGFPERGVKDGPGKSFAETSQPPLRAKERGDNQASVAEEGRKEGQLGTAVVGAAQTKRNKHWFSRQRAIFLRSVAPEEEVSAMEAGVLADGDDPRGKQELDLQLSREEVAVRDVEYPSDEEFMLNDEERGKLVASELDSSAEATRVRRRRGEGARWDPTGLGLDTPAGPEASAEKSAATPEWRQVGTDEELATFGMSVAVPHAAPLRVHAIVRSKLRYLLQEIWSDLRLHHASTGDFWFSVLLYVMAFWARMYVHFLGQWLFLKGNSVPLFGFEMQVYMIEFKYIFTSITTGVEIGVVMMGPLSCIVVLTFLSAIGATLIAVIGATPEWLSKFSAAFAVGTVLDPLLVLAVDVMASNHKCVFRSEACAEDYTDASCRCVEGDAFKLWTRLEEEDSGGVMGLLYTVIIYAGLMIIATTCGYGYFIWVHMNGRMLDVNKRVHSPKECFFLPHDFELSHADLASICANAKHWTGHAGEQMVVEVHEYETSGTDAEPGQSREVSSHISIFTVMLDGKRCLWRHFLRSPDGALVEAVGETTRKLADTFGLDKSALSTNRKIGPGTKLASLGSTEVSLCGAGQVEHGRDGLAQGGGYFTSLGTL